MISFNYLCNTLILYGLSCYLSGIGQVLIHERFGCLEHDMPETMNTFVRAIEDMMYTSHQLIVFSNVHKRLNTKIWRTFEQSWDIIIDVGKLDEDLNK